MLSLVYLGASREEIEAVSDLMFKAVIDGLSSGSSPREASKADGALHNQDLPRPIV